LPFPNRGGRERVCARQGGFFVERKLAPDRDATAFGWGSLMSVSYAGDLFSTPYFLAAFGRPFVYGDTQRGMNYDQFRNV
jgi:hypothetical protein